MPKKKVSNAESIFPLFQPVKVKYKDLFDIKWFYESLQGWLLDNDWMDEEDGPIMKDHWESFYGEKSSSSGAKELWIQWRMCKPAPAAQYLKYYMDFNFHVIGLTNTEVIREGRKIPCHKGEVELTIQAWIAKEYLGKFDESSVLKPLKVLFEKRVYHKVLQQRRKELYQEVYALQNFIKQWFKMKRYLPYEESRNFYPSAAWPSHLKE